MVKVDSTRFHEEAALGPTRLFDEEPGTDVPTTNTDARFGKHTRAETRRRTEQDTDDAEDAVRSAEPPPPSDSSRSGRRAKRAAALSQRQSSAVTVPVGDSAWSRGPGGWMQPGGAETGVAEPDGKQPSMAYDLFAYLESFAPDLCHYLDDDHGLGLGTVDHLYRYGLALLQGTMFPARVAAEWEDFFPLAEAFVLAYGSDRLYRQNQRAALLAVGRGESPHPLTGTDRSMLVDLVRELGLSIVAYTSYEPE